MLNVKTLREVENVHVILGTVGMVLNVKMLMNVQKIDILAIRHRPNVKITSDRILVTAYQAEVAFC